TGDGGELDVIEVDGVVNGTEFTVQPSVPATAPAGTQGFLLLGGRVIVAVKQETVSSFSALPGGDMTAKFGRDPADYVKLLSTSREDGSSTPVTVRQIWIEDGPIGEIFLKLLASTGTAGYNHPTYDVYPRWLGAGIPWQLLDWSSILGMGGDR